MSKTNDHENLPGVFIPSVITNGKVDVAAMVRLAEEKAESFALEQDGTNAKVKDILDTKVWQKDAGPKGPRRRPTSEITRGVLAFLGNPMAREEEVKQMAARVDVMMSGDPDFIRVPRGPNAGWYYLKRFTNSERDQKDLATLREQIATFEKKRREKAAKAALAGEQVVDIDVEEDDGDQVAAQ